MKRIIMTALLGSILFGIGCAKQPEPLPEEASVVFVQEESSTEDLGEEITENIEEESALEESNFSQREFEIVTNQDGREVCIYGEIEVLIPQEWQDKYIVKRNGMELSFYYMGGLLGKILICENQVEEWDSYWPIAYTDQNIYYYCDYPVGSCLGDEEEFEELRALYNEVIEGITINAENVYYDADEYYLPFSASKEVPERVVRGMLERALLIARNEIYARHGRKFNNPVLQEHFGSCSWYTPSVEADEFDENVLSDIEKRNIEVIKEREKLIKEWGESYPQLPPQEGLYSLEEQADGSVICKFNEITFTIPAEWKNKYVIEASEDRISFFSKLSYEYDTETGYVCSIARMQTQPDWAEKKLIQEANGYYYYIVYPSDVPYVQSGIPKKVVMEIAKEYKYLMETGIDKDSVIISER